MNRERKHKILKLIATPFLVAANWCAIVGLWTFYFFKRQNLFVNKIGNFKKLLVIKFPTYILVDISDWRQENCYLIIVDGRKYFAGNKKALDAKWDGKSKIEITLKGFRRRGRRNLGIPSSTKLTFSFPVDAIVVKVVKSGFPLFVKMQPPILQGIGNLNSLTPISKINSFEFSSQLNQMGNISIESKIEGLTLGQFKTEFPKFKIAIPKYESKNPPYKF